MTVVFDHQLSVKRLDSEHVELLIFYRGELMNHETLRLAELASWISAQLLPDLAEYYDEHERAEAEIIEFINGILE